MINFHPDQALLAAYAADSLPLGMTIAVAIHVERCPHCAALVAQYEQALSQQWLRTDCGQDQQAMSRLADLDAMLEMIMDQPCVKPLSVSSSVSAELVLGGHLYRLPKALRGIARQQWQQFGPISRSRLQLTDLRAEGSAHHAALMWMQPGAAVPHHSHGGVELMVPIAGAFADELGDYVPGDFILRAADVAHQPHSTEGCLCFSLLDAPVHFTRLDEVKRINAGDLLY